MLISFSSAIPSLARGRVDRSRRRAGRLRESDSGSGIPAPSALRSLKGAPPFALESFFDSTI